MKTELPGHCDRIFQTDLVKVFLFKQGHIARYKKLGKHDLIENRTMFREYANRSIHWLEKEIEIAKPYAVILLGLEITSTLCSITDKEAKTYFNGKSREFEIGKNYQHNCFATSRNTYETNRKKSMARQIYK